MALLLMDSLGILARPCRLKTRYASRNVLLLFRLTTCMFLQTNKQVAHSAKHAISFISYLITARPGLWTGWRKRSSAETNFIYQENHDAFFFYHYSQTLDHIFRSAAYINKNEKVIFSHLSVIFVELIKWLSLTVHVSGFQTDIKNHLLKSSLSLWSQCMTDGSSEG